MPTKIKKEKVSKKKVLATKTKRRPTKVVRPKPAKKPKVKVVRPKPAKKPKVTIVKPRPEVSEKKSVKKIIAPTVAIEAVPVREAVADKTRTIDAVVPEKIIPSVAVVPTKKIPEVKLAVVAPPVKLKDLEVNLPITIKDLAVKIQEKPSVLIKALLDRGITTNINQTLDEKTTTLLCEKFGFKVTAAPDEEELALREHKIKDEPYQLQPRAPVVTLMGHVDHGKTSLLDAIRKTKVVESEYGGITQHIGAYRVVLPHGEITFLDTPGHEAFTAMRARGASITDLVVLVVAADDGVMPQTCEAIDHARAAGTPIIVAINKIDKPQANIERVKKQLSELNLTSEDWGGKTITVVVSAKTGQGIDDLLEMILLEAQMLELKANPKRLASGVVIEAKLSQGRGPQATLLVKNGTLHLNESILVGQYYGKIKAMFDEHGKPKSQALPSFPIEVLGLDGIPEAGEPFFVIPDEKTARELALRRKEKEKQQRSRPVKRISLEDLHSQIKEGRLKELKLILKADVQGSLEAIKETLNKLRYFPEIKSEIKLEIIHEGLGSINTSDAMLAAVSDALILGFNVTVDERAKEIIAREGLDSRIYNIIYELANDIKQALEGMLAPKLKKLFLGKAEVRKVFQLSRTGTVAGCFVTKGRVLRTGIANLIRNGQVIFEGKISSLKRFKDDVREVSEGFECGIALADFQEIKEGDIIEVYEIEKIAREL